ncbi:Late embryogenesis abundant (LEA) hydroxyproline-rich glycoprotein family [Striga hermonthica]|uniref:Late embryogenesis abundant (LEA) hydroxyproline-rich glycoprotein family n=1 Tax=Striga hermonthica TaxID=68872 RepID=A0A9N7NGX9_STRHE|nr:Late embryogenesis abundant (LEA) hydroxyproline-rich glycoprotein family [Striga hermonthica]
MNGNGSHPHSLDVEAGSPSSLRPTKPEDTLMTPPMARKSKSGKYKCICLCVTAAILGLGLLFLILGLTVFKVKRPLTSVDSVSLDDLDFSVDFSSLRLRLNLTLDLRISVTNPNRVGFRYANSTALLRYRGDEVGQVPVPAGRIGARDTRSLNLTLTLMADRLLANSAIFSDAVSGRLPFQTYVRLAGKVQILFNFHVVTYSTCDLEVAVSSRTLSNQRCHYRTEL